MQNKIYAKYIKTINDASLAITLIIILCPLIFFIAILLLFTNRGKILFIQERPGKNGRPFKLVKFKSMNDKKDADGNLLPDHMRLTTIGRFMRKFSIDELPQLLNVLTGSISIIGPRPLLMEYIPLYNKHQNRRHEVRPGITGWAQVNGRNAITWEEKFDLDIFYVDHLSFFLDVKIVFLTILKIIRSEGINSSETTPMEKFTGTKE